MLYLKFPEGNHEVSPIISQLAARSSPWASGLGLGLPESFAEFLREVQDFFAEALAHLERMVPSGYVKIIIENGHRNSWFTITNGDFP